MSYNYDLFTIGAGSGGVRASRISANYGARVAVAEHDRLGGTCVNVGCVPKKLLVYAAHFREEFEDAAGFGWTVGDRTPGWQRLIRNKDEEINRLNGIYAGVLDGAGVERIEGRARLVDANTVAVGDREYTTRYILIATGSSPKLPPVPGIKHVITSNEAFYLPDLPSRVIIVGGGYIAVEFAGIFNGLGSETRLLYRSDLFLRGFDEDVRTTVRDEMIKKGVHFRFNANVERIDKRNGELVATLHDGTELTADTVMYATGRTPHTANLGLEDAGVCLTDKGAVAVDAFSQSSVPSVYAIGDVTDRVMLTPVAIHEGMALAATLFKDSPTKPCYENIPSAVFSQPPVGSVGLTEAAARKQYTNVGIYRSDFRALKHTLSGRDEKTMMKLVVDADSDRVLGVHMVGPNAGEIIQGFAVALQCGATKARFDATIGVHPTAAEEFVTLREKSTE